MTIDTRSRTQAFVDALTEWMPAAAEQRELRLEYLDFLDARGASALDRDGGPEHLTASCFVFTPDFTHTLLCFHKKGQFWVQLGGHIEASDASVASAAVREAHEESGLSALELVDAAPYDLNRHALAAAFGRCTTHWDIGFVAFAEPDAAPVVSAESEAVAWWPVDALPPQVPDCFDARLRTVLRELRSRD
ncbi:NUDIX hydrolase [Rathayibacter soli]|uniref:NUDIX hydrolase n=1 Tax=Rathayibacter soli TaxID=3144168 RepID=UPI0027E3BE88|nr:NUDIX domain-containing protein [Glaciibacter superstes]